MADKLNQTQSQLIYQKITAQDLLVSQMVMVEFLFVNKSSKFYNNYLGNPMAWIAYFFDISNKFKLHHG